MRVLNLFQALRLALRLWRLDLSHVENFVDFKERFHRAATVNSHWTERQVQEAYDLWRRDIIKQEVDAEFKKTYLRELTIHLFRNRPRQINIITMVLLVVAVLFPPYYLTVGDQSISTGLAFAFDRHVGRIDGVYLLCELAVILALSWLAQRVVQLDHP